MKFYFKIEVDGGHLNGAHRYYANARAAKIAASKIIAAERWETVIIDIYTIDEKGNKKWWGTKSN